MMGISNNCHPENCHSEDVPRGGFPLSRQAGPRKKDQDLRGTGQGICFMHSLKSGFFAALALMLLCLAAPAAGEEFGRLFFTPQQRQDLDSRRAANRGEEEAPQISEGPLTVDGHMQRSSGRTTTWINGVPQYDSHASHDPARIMVAPNEDGPAVSLKIGQIYERASGKVRDSLNGGEITVGKSAPEVRLPARRGAAAKSFAPAR